MKKKLNQLKSKLSKEQGREVKATADTKKPKGSDIDSERENILSKGRSYIKPLGLNPNKALKITAFILAGLIVGILILFSVLIYRFQSDSDIVYGASRVIPFPAARVDGSFVGYDDYLFELRTLKSSSASEIAGDQAVDFSTPEGEEHLETLKRLAMAEAQRKTIIRKMARENGVRVTREELDSEIDHFIEQEGGQEQLDKAIEDFFGWNMNDFRGVIRIQMIEQKLVENEADMVLERVENGDDFAELAREFSSDGSAAEGGDLGYVDDETPFVQEFKDAALALEPGQTTGLVETQFGYHIIRATERDEEEGLRVSHILIDRSMIQREVQQRLDSATVRNFIGVDTQMFNEEPLEVEE